MERAVRRFGSELPGGGLKKRNAHRSRRTDDVGDAPVLDDGLALEVLLVVVQEEQIAEIACCTLSVALEAVGEHDGRVASERPHVQLGRSSSDAMSAAE